MNQTPRLLPTFGFVIGCLTVAALRADDPTRLERVRAELPGLVAERMVRGNLPGVSVVLVEDGRVIYAQGFGNNSLTYPDPVTPESIFRVASLTKQFTALPASDLDRLTGTYRDDDFGEVAIFRRADNLIFSFSRSEQIVLERDARDPLEFRIAGGSFKGEPAVFDLAGGRAAVLRAAYMEYRRGSFER